MSTIRIQRAHRQTLTALRRTAEAIARRIEQRHDVRWRWMGDSMELTAPPGIAGGARGRDHRRRGRGHRASHLPLALFPARGMVERKACRRSSTSFWGPERVWRAKPPPRGAGVRGRAKRRGMRGPRPGAGRSLAPSPATR